MDKRAIEQDIEFRMPNLEFYLIPGALVRVIQDDPANGMSQIISGEITRPLWTYTRFLTARPIRDTYGILETPDTDGLIDPGDAAIAWETGGSTLNGQMPARTQ